MAAVRTDRLRLLLPALVALLAHGAALWSGWVLFDDRELIRDHPGLDSWGGLPGLLFSDYLAHTEPRGMWRPGAVGLYFLDRQLWGASPIGFHLTNLVLHAATATGVAVLAQRLKMAPRTAVLAGCLFAVLPVHAEVVGWVVGRCDGLATFGVVAALVAHLSGRPWLAAGCLLLGLAGKESAAAAIPLAGLLAWSRFEPPGERRPVWIKAGVAAGAAVLLYTLGRAISLDPFFPPRGEVPVGVEQLNLFERLEVFGHAGMLMFSSLATGRGLCADHSAAPWWRYAADWQTSHLLFALPFFVGSIVAFVFAHRGRVIAMGLAWPIVAWCTVSQIVPLKVVQADRFSSLAAVGWAVAAAAACALIERAPAGTVPPRIARRWAMSLGATACLLYAWAAQQRHAVFHDPAAHAQDVINRYRGDAQAWNRLAIWADENGQNQTAERAYMTAVGITENPAAVQGRPAESAFMNLGTFYLEQGRLPEARMFMERAARRRGRPDPKLDYNLAALYSKMGDYAEAAALYRRVIKARERWVAPRRFLARLHAANGQPGLAANVYAAALEELAPHDADLRLGLAEAQLATGALADAVANAQQVLERFPNSKRAAAVLEQARNAGTPDDG